MTRRPPRRRRGLKLAAIFLGVLVVLWCGYWFASHRLVNSAIASAAASLAARGGTLACGEQASAGFPLSLDLNCGRASFADASRGMSATLESVVATAPLYWPGRVNAAVTGPFVLDLPSHRLALAASWSSASATVDAGLGGLQGGQIALDGLVVRRKGNASRLPFARLAAASAAASAGGEGGGVYRFRLAASDVRLKPNTGKAFPAFAGEAEIAALDFGSALGTDPARTILAWLAAGGEIELRRLTLAAGETGANATGSLSLSAEGVLSGELKVRLSGIDKLPALAEQIKPGSQDKVAQIVGALAAFTMPVKGAANTIETPVFIRDGHVSVGIIPVGTIPPLRF